MRKKWQGFLRKAYRAVKKLSEVLVLGDREFCSVDLGNWLKEKGVSFCLRLKKNHCIETEHLVWQRLDELGIVPGTSLYVQGKRVRKTRASNRI